MVLEKLSSLLPWAHGAVLTGMAAGFRESRTEADNWGMLH